MIGLENSDPSLRTAYSNGRMAVCHLHLKRFIGGVLAVEDQRFGSNDEPAAVAEHMAIKLLDVGWMPV